jgi:hypothetical protein
MGCHLRGTRDGDVFTEDGEVEPLGNGEDRAIKDLERGVRLSRRGKYKPAWPLSFKFVNLLQLILHDGLRHSTSRDITGGVKAGKAYLLAVQNTHRETSPAPGSVTYVLKFLLFQLNSLCMLSCPPCWIMLFLALSLV